MNSDPYTPIRQAVLWMEGFVCRPLPGDTSSWDDMVNARWSPDRIISVTKEILAETIAEQEQPGPQIQDALAQMGHPLFRTYIMGKLGYV